MHSDIGIIIGPAVTCDNNTSFVDSLEFVPLHVNEIGNLICNKIKIDYYKIGIIEYPDIELSPCFFMCLN